MRVGVISDTHGYLDLRALRSLAGVERILHAGDVGSQAILTTLEGIAPVLAVQGNIDVGTSWGRSLPASQQLTIENRVYQGLCYTERSKQKEQQIMLRYASEKDKTNRISTLTSLTVEQFEQLVEPFEHAFVQYMTTWTMEGKPRTARAYTPYTNSPLPRPEDRLLFVLSYLKVASVQVAHGALFAMTQSNANKWIHILLCVLHETLDALGDAPARHLRELHERLAQLQTEGDGRPFFITMAANDPSHAPTTPRNRKRVTAVRKSVTP